MPAYTAATPKENALHVPPGEYKVQIVGAKEKLSKQGNEMIELEVKILPNGPTVRDYLVFNDKSVWKVDVVRAAIGEAVVEGENIMILPQRFVGQYAICLIGEEPGTKNDEVIFNKIERWILPKAANSKPVADERNLADDDIPF